MNKLRAAILSSNTREMNFLFVHFVARDTVQEMKNVCLKVNLNHRF